MAIVTEQELIDAATDAQTLEDVVNGAANFGGDGLVHPRIGGDIKTLAKIEEEIETVGTGWLSLAQEWAEQDEDVVVTGTSEFSSKHYAAKSSTSATSASNSAAAAADAVASGLYNDVISIDDTDSPYTPVLAQEGTLFRCDCTSGDIVIDLSSLSTYGEDMKFAFVKVDSGSNDITVNRGGSDTINTTTLVSISNQFVITVLVGDLATANWITSIQTTGVTDNSVTLAKMEHGTHGDILYYGASGEPLRLGPATAGDVLESGGAGADPVWASRITTTETGDGEWTFRSTAKVGHILTQGQSLGDTGSGADLTGSTYEDLFEFFWDNLTDTNAPVSSGRGASAAADFSAGKTITIPDVTDRSPRGAGNDIDLGETAGTATAALATTNIPAHTHAAGTLAAASGGSHSHNLEDSLGNDLFLDSGGSIHQVLNSDFDSSSSTSTRLSTESGGSHSHTISGATASEGSGAAFSIIPPVVGMNYMISL